jgi:ClpP class serine protease
MLAASQIALALKRHPGKKIVVVPHYAMSGGGPS